MTDDRARTRRRSTHRQGGRAAIATAFALLYRRYRADVYRFAAHVSGSAAVAEDVVQDVFVAVIEDASGYRADRSGVLPWLLGIARNHVRRWRSRASGAAPAG